MNQALTPSRRDLLLRVLPACSLCMGCTRLTGLAATVPQAQQTIPLAKRSAAKSEMTYEEVFKFAYGDLIPVMNSLANQVGKERFIEMLQKATSEAAVRTIEDAYRSQPKRDLATYLADLKKPSPLYTHALTFEVVKDTEKEVEVRVTECLWARTFRQANAADIGYSMICHGDIAATKAYNPKIVMTRAKILMKGDDECRFRWVMEA